MTKKVTIAQQEDGKFKLGGDVKSIPLEEVEELINTVVDITRLQSSAPLIIKYKEASFRATLYMIATIVLTILLIITKLGG